MKNRIFLPIFFLLPLLAGAQPCITGRVENAETGKPLPYVTVSAHDRNGGKAVASVLSDTGGGFVISLPREGGYRITFAMMGYAADSLTVAAAEKEVNVGTVRLREGLQLDQITVSAKGLIALHNDRMIYNVEADPEARKLKMIEMMGKIPLMRSDPEDGKLNYQGQGVEKILINGEAHEMINTRLQFPMAFIRADVMSRIEVILPGSPEYNNTKAIINIITSRPLPNGYAAELMGKSTTNNVWDANANLVGKIRDKVVLSFGYNLSYADKPELERSSLKELFYETEPAGSQQSSGRTWSFNRRHDIFLRSSIKLWKNDFTFGVKSSIGEGNTQTRSDMSLTDASGSLTQGQHSSSHNATRTLPRLNGDVKYVVRLPKKYRMSLTYNYADNSTGSEYRLHTSYTPAASDSGRRTESDNFSRIHTAGINLLNLQAGAKHRLSGNAYYSHRNYHNMSQYYLLTAGGGYQAEPELENGLEYTQQVAGISSRYSYWTKKLSFSLSLGTDYDDSRGVFHRAGVDVPVSYSHMTLQPRISMGRSLWKRYDLAGSYYKTTRRPSMSQLDPYLDERDPMNRFQGNPDLQPEQTHNFEVALRKAALSSNSLMIVMRYSLINDAIEQITSTDAAGISTTSYGNLGRRDRFTSSLGGSFGLKRWLLLTGGVSYHITMFDSANPDVGANRTEGFGASLRAEVTPWKSASLMMNYDLNSNANDPQSRQIEYYHDFFVRVSQTLIKNRLFATVSVSNPFESHAYIKNVIRGENFRLGTRNERQGRIVGLSLRWNFGRLKDRVAGEENILKDMERPTDR